MALPIDHDLTSDELRRAVHLHSAQDTNTLKNGDIVESWDFAFRWDDDCRNAVELERWRFISDDFADVYVATLQPEHLTPSHDQLELLLASQTPEAKALLEQLTCRLPDGVRASYDEQIAARDCFAKHAGPLLLGTFYVSLVGGFSSPRITNVLHKTSYLVAPVVKQSRRTPDDNSTSSSSSAHREADAFSMPQEDLEALAYAPITEETKRRTSIRLLETLQMVLDILDCPTVDPLRKQTHQHAPHKEGGDGARETIEALEPLHGAGWQSLVRTRLLHAIVRRRLMRMAKSGSGRYDFAAEGYPLNAEDMTATLASFCVAPLWACHKMAAPVPQRYKAGYIAHWRHCGYLLGVPQDILIKHFDTSTPNLSAPNKIFASLLTHLFIHKSDLEAFKVLPPPSLPLLHSMSDQPPFRTPLWRHLVVARFFLGDQLATALGIPYATPGQLVRLRLYLWGVVIPEYFGQWYPRRGWDVARGEVTQELLSRVVRFSLGRRSTFRPHAVEPGGVRQTGDLPDEAIEAERQGFVLNSKDGQRALRRYRWLMVEMIVVTGAVAVVSGWASWRVVKMAIDAL